jgi:hypothetical protein
MQTTLFLTASERDRFEALPAMLREGWTVEEEMKPVFETDYELMIRASMADVSVYPELQTILDAARRGEKIDLSSLVEMPDSVIPEVLFAIGARGITVLMDELFANTSTDEDIQSLASFSTFRHDILRANASVPTL